MIDEIRDNSRREGYFVIMNDSCPRTIFHNNDLLDLSNQEDTICNSHELGECHTSLDGVQGIKLESPESWQHEQT